MESFLKPSASAEVSQVSLESESTETVASMSARAQDDVMKMIQERMDQIETELKNVRQLPASESSRAPSCGQWRGRSSRSNPGNCWNCVQPQRSIVSSRETGHLLCREPSIGGRTSGYVSTIIPTLSVTSGKDCVLEGLVNGVPTSILIDTGAATSVLNRDLWDKAKQDGSELGDAEGWKHVGVQGKPRQLYGSACPGATCC